MLRARGLRWKSSCKHTYMFSIWISLSEFRKRFRFGNCEFPMDKLTSTRMYDIRVCMIFHDTPKHDLGYHVVFCCSLLWLAVVVVVVGCCCCCCCCCCWWCWCCCCCCCRCCLLVLLVLLLLLLLLLMMMLLLLLLLLSLLFVDVAVDVAVAVAVVCCCCCWCINGSSCVLLNCLLFVLLWSFVQLFFAILIMNHVVACLVPRSGGVFLFAGDPEIKPQLVGLYADGQCFASLKCVRTRC